MSAWDWTRTRPLCELGVCLGVLATVAAVALARVVVAFRQRTAREEPVLRCIRESGWEPGWAADAYGERLAKRLRAKLGIGTRPYAVRGRSHVDLSFDYQGTTWLIAIQDRLPNLQRNRIRRDIAELFGLCTARCVARPTVAVVVGVPSGGRNVNLELSALRAALVYGAARPSTPVPSDLNYELVAVPIASIAPIASTSTRPPAAPRGGLGALLVDGEVS